MKIYSLRNKLLKSICLPLVLYIGIIGLSGYFIARHEIDEVYDSQMITGSNVLWFLSRDELQKDNSGEGSIDIDDLHLSDLDKEAFNEYADLRQFRIWKNNKIFLFSQNSIPTKDFPPFAEGFHDFKFDHDKWRVYSLHIKEPNAIIEVAEQYEARQDLITNIILDLILPFLLSLPLMIFLLSRVLRFGLSGIEKASQLIASRSPNDMSPLAIQQIPSDLLPLTQAIDSLFLRIKIALKREREFIDNAAHSLKTPLAALKIQAQLIEKVKAGKEQKEAIRDLLKGTDRASRLVEQLLVSSRIENHKYDLYPVSLFANLGNSVRLVKLLAEKKAVEINIKEPEKCIEIMADDELLSILFTNIIDNAIKYCPPEGKIDITTYRKGKHAYVEIADNGPGIKESEKKKILQRFTQGLKSSQSGNGLGLSIAKQITELLDAELDIGNASGKNGLIVTLTFKAV